MRSQKLKPALIILSIIWLFIGILMVWSDPATGIFSLAVGIFLLFYPFKQNKSQKKNSQIPRIKSEENYQTASHSVTVYFSKTGSVYHFCKDCGGLQLPYTMTMSEAKIAGLRPCKRCAQ